MSWYTVFYDCPNCGDQWQCEWSCACNDSCSWCGTKEIEPVDWVKEE